MVSIDVPISKVGVLFNFHELRVIHKKNKIVKTRSQRAVEERVLNDLRLAFKVDEIREAVFGQQGYDAVLLDTRANYEGSVEQTARFRNRGLPTGKIQPPAGRGKEAEIEEVLQKLQKLSKLVRTNTADTHSGIEVDLYLTLPIFYAGINCKVSRKKSFIDAIIREGTELEAVLKELEISRFKRVACKDDKVRRSQAKRRMAAKTSGSMEEKLRTPELNTPLKLARLNEMPDGPVDMATVSSTVVQNLAKMKAVVLEESDKITEGADLRLRFEVEAGHLEEQCRAKAREKMIAVMDDEFKKLSRALRGVQLGFHDRSIELEKRISQLEGEKNQLEENLTREREAFLLELEKEREAAALKPKEVRAESVAETERLVTASATSRKNLAGKLYQLRYTKARIMAFSEGNYEENEIMDEVEVEEMEVGLNVAKKTAVDNQETINQEIESSRLRVVDLEGLLEVDKKSSAELQDVCVCTLCLATKTCYGRKAKEEFAVSGVCTASLSKDLDIARERDEHTLLHNVEYAEEYVALISQYEDRLDDNVKLSLNLEEAKRQIEDKTATILSMDSALNQLTSELVELKEKAASGSRHEAELAEYRIRALNEEISDMKCNIRALDEQLLKREIDLDTPRTNLAVSEADFEKLSSSIVGKGDE
ncbi:hypothetical protein GIB67_040615 [Kingdonia uniflora]|uniref:Uncharacterized protein n=1 Tax=Kingdonia uniflora TaxID=39325 RepID=A0A7J7M927_9MAGN|nr:hypothetical protein GIB67_040615 [Kingdonia uniflora]